jgi:hypothetical protein
VLVPAQHVPIVEVAPPGISAGEGFVWMAVPAPMEGALRQLLSPWKPGDDDAADRASPTNNATPAIAGLSPTEEIAARAHGMNSRIGLHISGTMVGRGSGLILIGGHPIRLQARMFRLLLRLVVGLFETDDGFVPRGRARDGDGLIAEGFCRVSTMYQILGDLRPRIAGVLDVESDEFIESSRSRIRLSLPRRLVTWDAALAQYPDEKVRECAARLAAATARPSPAPA